MELSSLVKDRRACPERMNGRTVQMVDALDAFTAKGDLCLIAAKHSTIYLESIPFFLRLVTRSSLPL